MDLHIIIIYCDDMSSIDINIEYTVTVIIDGYINSCGTCVGCCGGSTGIITIIDPCISPVIEIGINIDISFTFNGPTTWNPPPCTVIPPVCQNQIVYICTYIGGPYVGSIDLCTYVQYTNVVVEINFDINAGTFVFDTNDSMTFPVGEYTFEISITIGITVHVTQFTMVIVTDCVTPDYTINEQPPSHTYYPIGSGGTIIWTFDMNLVVTSNVLNPCGDPLVVFTTDIFMEISIIYTIECDLNICNLITWCDDYDLVGDYSMQFIFFYSGMPGVYCTSDIFIVTVINIYLPPVGCINIPGCGIPDPVVNPPDVSIEISVTVGIDVSVVIPPWNCGTPGCDDHIIVDCTINCDIGGGGVVVIINNEINIHIDSCDCNGCCGDTPDGNVIIVVVTGCLDINICVDVDVPVTIYNPCLDINIFQLVPITIPDHECTIFGDPCEMPHQAFEIIAESEIIIEICLVIYTADGGDIDIFIEYNVDLHIVIFYCEDMDLVDQTFTITITVYVEGLIN
jgi:hypothetical protein